MFYLLSTVVHGVCDMKTVTRVTNVGWSVENRGSYNLSGKTSSTFHSYVVLHRRLEKD